MASADPMGRCGLYRGRCALTCVTFDPSEVPDRVVVERLDEPSLQGGCPLICTPGSSQECQFIDCLQVSSLHHCYQCEAFGTERCLVLVELYAACRSMALEEVGCELFESSIPATRAFAELAEADDAWECPECGARVGCWDTVCRSCGAPLEVGEA